MPSTIKQKFSTSKKALCFAHTGDRPIGSLFL